MTGKNELTDIDHVADVDPWLNKVDQPWQVDGQHEQYTDERAPIL